MFEKVKEWSNMPTNSRYNFLVGAIIVSLVYMNRDLRLKVEVKNTKIDMIQEQRDQERDAYMESLEKERARAMDILWRSIEMKHNLINDVEK